MKSDNIIKINTTLTAGSVFMTATPSGLGKGFAFSNRAMIGGACAMKIGNQLLQNEESDESSGTNGFGNYGSTYPVDTDAEKDRNGVQNDESEESSGTNGFGNYGSTYEVEE